MLGNQNATSATRIPELPEGVKHMVLRKRIIKRPQRRRRGEKQEVQPVLNGAKL